MAGAPRTLPGRVGSRIEMFSSFSHDLLGSRSLAAAAPSFLPLKRSFHVPYMTGSDWSPYGCCQTHFCCVQGARKCIWNSISPDFLLLWDSLHLLPGTGEWVPWAVPAPQPSSTGNRLLNICLEHLTLDLDIFKAVNSTHHGCRGKPPAFFSRQLMGRNLSQRCSDEQKA